MPFLNDRERDRWHHRCSRPADQADSVVHYCTLARHSNELLQSRPGEAGEEGWGSPQMRSARLNARNPERAADTEKALAQLAPLLGLDFRNVLGDALCDERGLARRLSHVAQGPRDIVFVPNWFTNCELLPELPSLQGWVEAMTSLGRLIFFDQPGTGASDPVTPGALPTLEQWADSITAVLDDLGSREAVLVAVDGAFATRRCSRRHIRRAPPRWSCSRAYAEPG